MPPVGVPFFGDPFPNLVHTFGHLKMGGGMNSLVQMARAGKAIHVLGSILGILLCSLSLFSQVTAGTISGTVQDSSGAAIPGATVTIRNLDTGMARSVTADEGGRYATP